MQKIDIQKRVQKFVLSNGLTVLVCPKNFASKVSLQLWYNVGSKDEASGEKGMAHFIEHMIFKGTQSMLSESDINMITQKLSGYTNAFTSYDYTGYLFDLPVANWTKVLPIFADCMKNVLFDPEHMNSEVKAVIQELKMYKDDYSAALAESLVTTIFESHPYHYPLIGYKQDLWSLQRQTLMAFYQKYYIPQNAALVVVGDVDPANVLKEAEKAFGGIARGQDIERKEFFVEQDLKSKSVTLYREVAQPTYMLAFLLPGAKEKKEFMYDIISYVLANGKSSRLYNKLVDQLELATSVHAMSYDLFDQEVFFIEFQAKQESNIAPIREIVFKEISDLIENGIPDMELRRALKLAQMDYQDLLEDVQKQAYAIGKAFVATGDEEYPFTYCNYQQDKIAGDVVSILKQYFKETVCCDGKLVKPPKNELTCLTALQEESDALDTKILFGKERQSPVAPGLYVNTIEVEKFINKPFPVAQKKQLENNLTVLVHANPEVEAVECLLQFKANQLYDPQGKEGAGYLVSKMMIEGTKLYPGSAFIKEAESYGISIQTSPGQISIKMLSCDLAKGFELLGQMVMHAEFVQADFIRVKNKLKAQLIQVWDTPTKFMAIVAAQQVYGSHQYGRFALGTEESLDGLTVQECFDLYKKFISPCESILSISGKFKSEELSHVMDKYLGSWQGTAVADLQYPVISPVSAKEVTIEKKRDQIVLAFAGISLSRLDPLYDYLLVFGQILSGGMNSRLFALREQSGLFYTIGGSLVYGSGKQPGMIFIKTIVSKDRLHEAEKAIAHCLATAIDSVTEQELDEAREMIVNGFAELFDTNESASTTFLFLQQYKLPQDYFETRIDAIRSMTLDQMKQAVKKYLNVDRLLRIRIGRI